MKKRTSSTRDGHKRRLAPARNADRPRADGARESRPSRETFPERRKRPGDVGLANEMRPGLGTRATKGKTKATTKRVRKQRHDKEPLGRVAPLPPAKPRPASREEPEDAFAREQERDTGVSGHASAD